MYLLGVDRGSRTWDTEKLSYRVLIVEGRPRITFSGLSPRHPPGPEENPLYVQCTDRVQSQVGPGASTLDTVAVHPSVSVSVGVDPDTRFYLLDFVQFPS